MSYKYTHTYIDGVEPLANPRDLAALWYNPDGSARKMTIDEDRISQATTAKLTYDELIPLILSKPDDKLAAFAKRLYDAAIDPTDPMLVKDPWSKTVLDAEGFPISGPARAVWLNLPRAVAGKPWTAEYFDNREALLAELEAL